MKTPNEYSENLKSGVITDEMISDVLYSYSKRAKNYRDKEREYRSYFRSNRYAIDWYGNESQCREKKELLYSKKDDILKCYANHLVKVHYQESYTRKRVYDYDEDLEKKMDSLGYEVVWSNCYYDYDEDREVFFNDYAIPTKLYFLYYEFPGHTFHTPIDECDVKKLYKDLEQEELIDFETFGKDVNDLLSLQFCDKVWRFVTGKE